MAVTLENLELAKESAFQNISLDTAIGTIQESDTAEKESVFVPLNFVNVTRPSFLLSAISYQDTSDTFTVSAEEFGRLDVGDEITGQDIPTVPPTTVLAKTAPDQIQLSANPNAAGTDDLSATPPVLATLTFAGVDIIFSRIKDVLVVTLNGHFYDGTLEDTEGTVANSVPALVKTLNTFEVKLSELLPNARYFQQP
jgi:hypothetical protein